jgi:hypothetical protein
MNVIKYFVMSIAVCILLGCGKPLPADKVAYVGEWQAKNMVLNITSDGQVNYQRKEGNTSTSINAPIKQFHGNDFEVGLGPFATNFSVSKPPYQDGTQWKMVVDGVELLKTP